MNKKDFLKRLADLEVTDGEQRGREFTEWCTHVSREDMDDYLFELDQFSTAIGLPLDQLEHVGIEEAETLYEVLVAYAEALWRAYDLGPEVKERVKNRATAK